MGSPAIAPTGNRPLLKGSLKNLFYPPENMLAYVAWKDATKGQDLQSIGGFTPDQRFYIGMAQWACGDERPENKRLNAITNPHSPDEYRINGVVSNMSDFAKAFSCKGWAADGAGARVPGLVKRVTDRT